MEINELLANWLQASSNMSAIKNRIDELMREKTLLENEEQKAIDAVQSYLSETGEYEVDISGEYCDYKIYYTTPRESVKVESPDAVPDEFCKIERKPKLKEIKAFIDEGNQVNWATIEKGKSNLTYKLVKKG